MRGLPPSTAASYCELFARFRQIRWLALASGDPANLADLQLTSGGMEAHAGGVRLPIQLGSRTTPCIGDANEIPTDDSVFSSCYEPMPGRLRQECTRQNRLQRR